MIDDTNIKVGTLIIVNQDNDHWICHSVQRKGHLGRVTRITEKQHFLVKFNNCSCFNSQTMDHCAEIPIAYRHYFNIYSDQKEKETISLKPRFISLAEEL